MNTMPPVDTNLHPTRHRSPVWLITLLVILALLIIGGAGTFFALTRLHGIGSSQTSITHAGSTPGTGSPQAHFGSLYQGQGYTITPLAGWQTQSDGSGGVIFSDPHFPQTQVRDASELGVMLNQFPLMYLFGSSASFRCQQDTGVGGTVTLTGASWDQSQYHCGSLQEGGITDLLHFLSITQGGVNYAIYYLTTVDRPDDITNGAFTAMMQTFTFR